MDIVSTYLTSNDIKDTPGFGGISFYRPENLNNDIHIIPPRGDPCEIEK